MLTQTAEYALRAVLFLANEGSSRPVRVDDIATALDVPKNYLSKILHAMTRAGIVISTRGPHGGFQMGRRPEELSLAEVVSEFDVMDQKASCLLGRSECDDADPCAAHARWKDVSERVRSFFRETTIAELAVRSAPKED